MQCYRCGAKEGSGLYDVHEHVKEIMSDFFMWIPENEGDFEKFMRTAKEKFEIAFNGEADIPRKWIQVVTIAVDEINGEIAHQGKKMLKFQKKIHETLCQHGIRERAKREKEEHERQKSESKTPEQEPELNQTREREKSETKKRERQEPETNQAREGEKTESKKRERQLSPIRCVRAISQVSPSLNVSLQRTPL